ncbi:MFS transporter [Sphingobium sp. BYY-5]|uniref:MFS transporter n=1 Tax=Sphingobium sp. BYY-5 TaxID=2926400 RepID=UPI001FA7EA0F|nr:MFS transporter [Sphingobium sp. BYY-5]MCI4590789.1 MFS transporter [Sphingobium sp. BYY-5]
MRSLRAFFDDEAHDFPAHERPAAVGSPASPSHKAGTRLAHMVVGVLVGTTVGLGGALVSANLVQVRQVLGLSPTQAAWLSTSYVAAAVPANLLLIKVRQQYGLRRFALVALGLYVAAALAQALVTDIAAMVLLRAIGGFVSVTLIPLCLFHTMQAFPTKWRLRGLVLGIGITQCAVPLARLLSPSLLGVDGWRSLFLLEAGLALLSLAAVGVLRLPPAERARVLEPLDLFTFVLLGGALAAITAALGLGRFEGWLHTQWIVVTLLASPPALLAAGVIELRRATPLIDLRWLTHGDVWRFAAAVFLIRLVLAEQEMALDAVRWLGARPNEFESLAAVMLASAVTGVLASTMCVNLEKIARPMMLAIGIVAIAALVDSAATEPRHLARLYVSQAAIAVAGTFFLGPALLLGITSALRHGSGALISFIVLFGVVNALGAVAGPALLGSYMDWRLAAGAAEQAARADTIRLAAVLGLATTLYLAGLLLLRVRRRLAELRAEVSAGAASKEEASTAGSGWTQPRVLPAIGAIMAALAICGVMLILAAFGRV